jgi:hypothetical protein
MDNRPFKSGIFGQAVSTDIFTTGTGQFHKSRKSTPQDTENKQNRLIK